MPMSKPDPRPGVREKALSGQEMRIARLPLKGDGLT
jgi:hypothetical protein